MKMGKGKKGDFSLPDIIKKQGELSEKMKEGMKKGGEKPGQKSGQKPGEGQKGGEEGRKPGDKGKPGSEGNNANSGDAGKSGKNGKGGKDGEPGENGKGNGEGNGENDDLDGELYEIYKQQSKLRQELQNAIKESENGNPGGNTVAKKALKTMEQLENEILEKGFNAGTLQRMQRLNYELLKLDAAALEQGEDKKRKSTANFKESERNKVKALQFKKQFYNQIEILNRQSLPLQENYKIKVREYFSEPQKKQK